MGKETSEPMIIKKDKAGVCVTITNVQHLFEGDLTSEALNEDTALVELN